MAFLEGLQGRGIKLGLGRIEAFLKSVGRPHEKFRSVHIAGTNGKGSTAAMLESILREAGYKTGLYTSPHLVRFNERIQVNGSPISDSALAQLISETKDEAEKFGIHLTFFEFLTVMAFKRFASQGVDFAVVETGMGGRLDATNVVKPLVCAITNVERDHQQFLGNAIENIASEKAGVIKQGIPVVTAEWKKTVLNVFRERALEKNASLRVIDKPFEGRLGLLGSFQKWNAALALSIVEELQKQGIGVSEEAVEAGLLNASWPGRFQIVRKKPTVILDCAHNPACCVVLARSFKELFPGKKASLVFGASSGKEVKRMAALLSPIAEKACVTAANYRGMPFGKTASFFESRGFPVEKISGVENALKKALSSASRDDVILVAGSCFLVGEAIEFFNFK